MLISYPFLPAREAGQSDADYEQRILDEEMLHAGVYPSSREREWHGGIHLQAPSPHEPVRAIADGTLVAYRLNTGLTKERPGDETGRIDNSFVLIRHETETDVLTGDNGVETPVRAVFYSLYMHLMNAAEIAVQGLDRRQIHTAIVDSGQAVKPGHDAKIYRKDIIGFPGESYSTSGMIHFEIFTTDDALSKFFVDSQNTGEVGTKGIWGDSYFIVKAGSLAVGAHPHGSTTIGDHVCPVGTAGPVDPRRNLFVRIAYRNGTKYTTTWIEGEEDRPPTLLTSDEGVADPDYEYSLYDIATALYPSCPSAGMDLLRLGRMIGPDTGKLAANEKHNWQFVTYAAGQQGYLDLADPAVVKQVLSDADFPYWLGWQKGIGSLFLDYGVCDMHELLNVLKVSHDGEQSDVARRQLHEYFADSEHRHLRDWAQRLVIQYPSEWDKANNSRCARLKEKDGLGPGRDGPYLGNDDEYEMHMKFVESLQWWDEAGLGDSRVWHFHPFAFIRLFRKCGWLSRTELLQLLPSNSLREATPWAWENVSLAGADSLLSAGNSLATLRRTELNKALRKYGVTTPIRKACFFGNATQETQWFMKFHEGTPYWYKPWDGRGFLQLTHAENYIKYWSFRGFVVGNNTKSILLDHTILANNNRPIINEKNQCMIRQIH